MSKFDHWVTKALKAAPHGDRLARSKGRLAALADQAAQGGANFILGALLARSLSRSDYASIGVMLAFYYFFLGFYRANVVLPFILDSGAEGRPSGSWWRVCFTFVAGLAVLLAVCAGGLLVYAASHAGVRWVANAAAAAAVTAPLLLLADFGRRWLYQSGLSATAALCSTIYFVAGVGAAAALVPAGRSLPMGVAAWAIAGAASVLASLLCGRPRFGTWREAVRRWKRHRAFSGWQSLAHLPYTLYNNSVVLLIGAFGGAAAASAFTVARTLATPAASIVSAVDSVDKPRAAAALATGGLRALRASVGRTRRLLAWLTGGYLLLLALSAGPVLSFVAGPGYAGEADVVRVLAFAFFLVCLNQPSETLLIVLRASRILLVTRTITALAAVTGLWIASRGGGVTGAAVAMLAVQALNLALLRWAERKAARDHAVSQAD